MADGPQAVDNDLVNTLISNEPHRASVGMG